jgi:hypothetical protein
MMGERYFRILVIIGLFAAICSAASAATEPASVRYAQLVTPTTAPPACTAPCECMANGSAQEKWGVNGYTQCSQTPCGRAATTVAVIPYYCFRPLVTQTTPAPVPCQAPCQCLERSVAVETWGADGFTQCLNMPVPIPNR